MAKVLLLLLLGGSFVFGFAFAQEVPEGCEDPGPRPEETNVSSWQVDNTAYRCGNNQCGGMVKQRVIEFEEQTRTFHTPEEDENHCPVWEAHTVTTSTGATRTSITDVPLGKYQACPESANNQWVSSFPGQCSGKCYPVPEILPLNNESLQPKNVFDQTGKPKLPLNIGWKDNAEKQLSSDGAACQVSSYEYKIKQGSSLVASNQVSGSSHSTLVGENSCALNPGSDYNFEVRACAGNTCSNPGTLPFSASPAPQLLYPYDSDWEGKENAFGDMPATLAWCPAPGVRSFLHQIYKDQVSKQNLVWENVEPSSVTSYEDLDAQVLQKDNAYFWRVAPCTSSNIGSCGIFSQLWSFVPTGAVLSAPKLRKPLFDPNSKVPAVPVVNLGDLLEWQGDSFTPFFYVEVGNGPLFKQFIEHATTPVQLPFSSFWHWLDLATTYQWKVWACSNNTLDSCEGESETWQFKTTGEPPSEFDISPREPGGTGIALPATFDWDAKPGAASYQVQFGGEQSKNILHAKDSQITLDYPFLAPIVGKSEAKFVWRVRTCADEAGTICGSWSEDQRFMFAPLKTPNILEPSVTQTEFAKNTRFAWTKDFGSNFFSYQLKLLKPSPEEQSSLCKNPHPVAEGLAKESAATIRLPCLGQYEFSVTACINAACEFVWSGEPHVFTVQKFFGKAGGLIPCDANNDNLATIGLDEREPCGLKHLLLLARNLVDFALWKLTLIILIAMTAFTGFTMYTSFGGMEVMARVRSIWKAVGIGFLILLFSWLFLNLLLGIAGFQVNIFGKWYELGI